MTTTTFNGLRQNQRLKKAGAAFFWLAAFFVIYCARPEDWVPAIGIIPLAKLTGIGAFLAFLFGTGVGKRKFREMPSEAHFLLAMLVVLMISSLLSPVWKGGAVSRTLDFSKVYVAWALVFFLITDIKKLRQIIFIQAAAVPLICVLSIAKGHSHPRLEGVLGGIYSNPNDLAFAIVLSLPFCFMFLLTARGIRKLPWIVGMLAMGAALILTESRGGFITLVVSGAVALWHFGVKGKRFHLIAATALVGMILLAAGGGPLKERFATMWSDDADSKQQTAALGSYEQRKYLMKRALECIEHYPIFGVGTRDFEVYSLQWREVHMTYLQIAAEGGLLSLILYLLFFARGFRNLRVLLKRKDLDKGTVLIVGALHSSLIGFVVGALFSPEAYVYFPYFTVAYTSALWAIVKRNDVLKAASAPPLPPAPSRAAWQLPASQTNPNRVPVGQ
jgi:O-antigen ligase